MRVVMHGRCACFQGVTVSDSPVTQLLHAAASNPAVRAQLLTDPRAALAAAGVAVPANVAVSAIEGETWGVQLTLGPAADALGDDVLDEAAGGASGVTNRLWP